MAEKIDCFCSHVGNTKLANDLLVTYPTIKKKIKAKYSESRKIDWTKFYLERKVFFIYRQSPVKSPDMKTL